MRLVDRSLVVAVSAVHSRYRLLETLRAYGRNRIEDAGIDRALAHRHATYYVELAERAAHGLQGPDERAWVDDALADYGNMRAAFVSACADRDADLAVRLVASIPELVHLRIGYEASGWAERVLVGADPTPAIRRRARAAARGMEPCDFPLARQLAAGPRAVPPAGTPRIAHPGDVLADVALYEGDAIVRCGTTPPRRSAPAPRASGSARLTLYYVAICEVVRRARARRRAGAGEPCRGRDSQPDGPVDGALRGGPGAEEGGARPR